MVMAPLQTSSSLSVAGILFLCVSTLHLAHGADWLSMTAEKVEPSRALVVGEVVTLYSQWPASNYTNGTDRTLTLSAPSGNSIHLEFFVFETEEYYDYLDFYDGPTKDSARTRRFSGKYFPAPVTSTGNAATLRFRTNDKIEAPGFRIIVTVVPSLAPSQGTQELNGRLTEIQQQLKDHVTVTENLFEGVRNINNTLHSTCASKKDLAKETGKIYSLLRKQQQQRPVA